MNRRGFLRSLTLAATAFALGRFIARARKRYQVRICEGGMYPPFLVWCWLRIEHYDRALNHDVLIVKLPSFQWEICDYGHYWAWLQLAIEWRGPFRDRGKLIYPGWSIREFVAREPYDLAMLRLRLVDRRRW